MIRGLYTGAAGMIAQEYRLDAVSNNLANVNVDGYKQDVAVLKAFPEILLRRMSDNGVYKFPCGSVDTAPMIGKLGTGVEMNELYTVFTQGALKQTDNPFDFALEGKGFIAIETPDGERYTRNGSFLLSNDSYLVTKNGDLVLGENGPIRIKANNFMVDKDGVVYQNGTFAGDEQRLVSMAENEWENLEPVDRLKIVDFHRTRYLEKVGNSYWQSTEESGNAEIAGEGVHTSERPKVRQGFLEGANVNPVTEMVQMIEVNRSYEANQKVVQSEDQLLGKLINETVRV